jgi:predicted flap endonuclease-1-like 5' DNA nuclease
MLHYLIELAVWLLGAYFAGACIGCLLRKLFGADATVEAPVAAAAVAAPAVAATVPKYTPPPIPVVAAPVAATDVAAAAVTTAAAAPVAAEPLRMAKMERPRGIAMARNGKPDDLLRISGVGPKNEKILHSLGFFHFDQIAGWTPEQVNWVDDHLRFGGRIEREEWINQARLLAEGNEAEFTQLYGTGGEGTQEAGLRTVRGPNEKAAESASAVALMSATEKAADDKDAAAGKMNKPKGIAKARGGKPDNLQRISGVGPKNESILHSLGFFHFDQISAWTSTEVNWVDDHLRFGGRIKREEWIRQARLLAEGKEAEFTKLYGTGGLKNKKGDAVSGSRTRKP